MISYFGLLLMLRLVHGTNWCDRNQLCQGNYGAPRRVMPQVTNNSKPVTDLFAKVYVDPFRVIPFQYDIYKEPVDKIVDSVSHLDFDSINNLFNQNSKIVLAQNPNGRYVLIDGHHRWASIVEISKNWNKRFEMLSYLSPFNEYVTWNMLHSTEKTLGPEQFPFISRAWEMDREIVRPPHNIR
jgi:hypothetical protein